MKILITGSSGFVGTHLAKKLSLKHKIVKYDLKVGKDILNEKLLYKNLKDVDLVIHLAALISASESWDIPDKYIQNNTLGTSSVIRNAIKAGVKKIIFFSSAAVKAKPLTPYAVSKIGAEKLVETYKDKINIVIIRPENIYGSGQREAYGYVINNFIKAVKNNRAIEIFGDGRQSRDFVYIDDVVSSVVKVMGMEIKSGVVVSLGTGKSTQIKELANDVMKIMKNIVQTEFGEARDEPKSSVANTKMMVSLGIKPNKFVNLISGVKKLIKLQYS